MKNEIEFFKYSEQIKNVTRFERFKEQHESVASHIFGAMFIAHDLMDRFNLKVDKAHVLELVLFHDLAEAGMEFDFAAPECAGDESVQKKKEQLEMQKIEHFSKKFNKPFLLANFKEFEKGETRESKLANLCDKMDAQNHMVQNGCAGLDCAEEFDFNIHYADKFIQYFPELDGVEKELQSKLSALKNKFLSKK